MTQLAALIRAGNLLANCAFNLAQSLPDERITATLKQAQADWDAALSELTPAAPAPTPPAIDYAGHNTLASMVGPHIDHWQRALQERKATFELAGCADDASFMAHELGALKAIELACSMRVLPDAIGLMMEWLERQRVEVRTPDGATTLIRTTPNPHNNNLRHYIRKVMK